MPEQGCLGEKMREKMRSDVWKLVQGHPLVQHSRIHCENGRLRFGLGAELVMALMDKGQHQDGVGRVSGVRGVTNLLQYMALDQKTGTRMEPW